MRYDLPLLVEYCAQQGIPHKQPSDHLVEIQLKEGVLLCFQNEEDADDCAVGFEELPGTPMGTLCSAGTPVNTLK